MTHYYERLIHDSLLVTHARLATNQLQLQEYYCTTTVLLQYYYCTTTILALYYYALLLSYCRSATVLLLCSG